MEKMSNQEKKRIRKDIAIGVALAVIAALILCLSGKWGI